MPMNDLDEYEMSCDEWCDELCNCDGWLCNPNECCDCADWDGETWDLCVGCCIAAKVPLVPCCYKWVYIFFEF